MKHFIFILLSTLIGLVSCNSNAESGSASNPPKQFKFGAYTFIEAEHMSNIYSCPVEDYLEADKLFQLFFRDAYDNKDYKNRKYFQKYGVIIEPWDIVEQPELKTYKKLFVSDVLLKQDKYSFSNYVVCAIYTPEEYEQREKEFQQSEQEKNNRLKSLE